MAAENLRHIPLEYSHEDSQNSALRLILALRPEWEQDKDEIEFVRFTEGITNTLLKAEKKQHGWSDKEVNREAVLLRAYGDGTDVLIDREKEVRSHFLLSKVNLAPPLLARFNNGLLYKFTEGSVCTPEDLRRPEIWHGVARRLGEWHAILPVSVISSLQDGGLANGTTTNFHSDLLDRFLADKPKPNLWSLLQRWIVALPSGTAEEKERQKTLFTELEWAVGKLGSIRGVGDTDPFVFAHCDLLSGNVIVQASSAQSSPISLPSDASEGPCTVSFIDYEYSTAAPAVFDISNHFAEWAGFDCDYNGIPTRPQRLDFLQRYLQSYNTHSKRESKHGELEKLFSDVDLYRGMPGFYWGIWALIQATISHIDFDYASYAEIRLGEYWAWKADFEGKKPAPDQLPLRERRWHEE